MTADEINHAVDKAYAELSQVRTDIQNKVKKSLLTLLKLEELVSFYVVVHIISILRSTMVFQN